MKFATRINSFITDGDTVAALHRISKTRGIDYVDLNYPEHFNMVSPEEMKPVLDELGLTLNSVAMRFRRDFVHGEYSNRDESTRREAIELTKRGIDAAALGGSDLVTVWLGYDGFDYTFQKDYAKDLGRIVEAFQELADYRPDVRISIEYKPYEERVHSVIRSVGQTLHILRLIDRPNVGATLDFAHMLMAGDAPGFGAALLLEEGKLWGVHLNDGNNDHDDGLMIGSIHPFETLEFLYYLRKYGYDDVIYFDTFPIRENAQDEAETNRATVELLMAKIDAVGVDHITSVIAEADGIASQNLRNLLLSAPVPASN
ncbi:sugar phosphate isomerase/epimerase family protein [Microbacterium testaceum]|jgi:Predicted sugar isomerase|uniref:sugar phosphate isomerase/epimerase family protein n=1 Tax=Microbacterium testaceum TaxID=2033 RepID=UPI002AC6E1B3|nr:sugar phosphate isomerase/epimerase family protein [Microbacterium testaceum]MDZ5146269.1 sugar phosphate isomerase/epimerase [Microbacterium testaceum]